MTDLLLHETIYRGREAIEKLGRARIAVCGAGALGSLLVDNLVRQGARQVAVADFDRVELHNAGSQLYGKGDVGAFKVDVLQAHCFRASGVEIEIYNKRLDERNASRFLKGANLVIDAFDNSASRRVVASYCLAEQVPCLHLGMNADYGEVRWNEVYRVPADVVAGDVCDYPLARNLILLVVAAGSEAVLRAIVEGRHENYAVTLRDLKISAEKP
jgi:molybdopterin/thiamine biosynthesis adenylyltransferase